MEEVGDFFCFVLGEVMNKSSITAVSVLRWLSHFLREGSVFHY